MTQKEIARKFAVWCQRMLVSGAWKFELTWDETGEEIGGSAQISMMRNYRHATVQFARDEYKEWDSARVDEIIVHELMHTFTHPLKTVGLEIAENNLGGTAKDMAEEWLRREDEFVVDHIASVIRNGYGPA